MNFREKVRKLKSYLEEFPFKVGDKVKITVDGSEWTGLIDDVSPKGGFYLVNIGGKKGYYHGKDMKLLKREELYRVGEKVKTAEGFTGVVTKVDRDGGTPVFWVSNKGPFTYKECTQVIEDV